MFSETSRCQSLVETNRPVVHRSYHDFGGNQRLSTSVLLALEELPTGGPDGEGATLFDSVDPDALDGLFEPISTADRDAGCVNFVVEGYGVHVSGDGEIVITAQPNQPA